MADLVGEKVTYADLEKLTGKTFRTVKKVLTKADLKPVDSNNKSQFFDSAKALEILFQTRAPNIAEAEVYDLQEQRAREAAMKADNLQIDRDKKLGKLLDAEEVERTWVTLVTATRSKVRAFPYKIIPRLEALSSADDKLQLMRKEIDDLLQDLSQSLSDEDEGVSDGD